MSIETLHFDALKQEKEYSSVQNDILKIVTNILPPTAKLQPAQAVREINNLFPRQHEGQKINDDDAEQFLWTFWNVTIDIVQEVPCLHPGHIELVELVGCLKQHSHCKVNVWNTEARLWEDLPLLGPCMRERWISPRLDTNQPDIQSAEKWQNLNSFAARLFGKGLVQWRNFAVWMIRDALEEKVDKEILEFHMDIVKEWIFHAGDRIFREAKASNSEDSGIMKAGSLYKGPAGLNLERWNFWKSRVAEILQQASGNSGVAVRYQALIWKMDEYH